MAFLANFFQIWKIIVVLTAFFFCIKDAIVYAIPCPHQPPSKGDTTVSEAKEWYCYPWCYWQLWSLDGYYFVLTIKPVVHLLWIILTFILYEKQYSTNNHNSSTYLLEMCCVFFPFYLQSSVGLINKKIKQMIIKDTKRNPIIPLFPKFDFQCQLAYETNMFVNLSK